MVTALVLQLIQCSVKIPEKVDEVQDAAGTEDGEDGSKPQVSLSSRTFMVFVVESSPPILEWLMINNCLSTNLSFMEFL